jgi:hypothetical protein
MSKMMPSNCVADPPLTLALNAPTGVNVRIEGLVACPMVANCLPCSWNDTRRSVLRLLNDITFAIKPPSHLPPQEGTDLKFCFLLSQVLAFSLTPISGRASAATIQMI